MVSRQLVQLRIELSEANHDYKKSLNSHAFAKMHDSTLSEDLVQQAFMKTWIYLAKGGKIDLMKAFLFHVLNNLIVDEYRKHKTSSLDAIMEKGFEPKINNNKCLNDYIDGKAAMLLIDKLPDKYKKIMRMRYIQNLSLEEIQLITGQSKNSIAVQAHRGLDKLRLLYNHKLSV
jgi:RNA polymerase sigma-70 factor (ECF subfamily)